MLQDIPEAQARAQVRFREESRTISYAGAVRGESELEEDQKKDHPSSAQARIPIDPNDRVMENLIKEVTKLQQQVSLLMEKIEHREGKHKRKASEEVPELQSEN